MLDRRIGEAAVRLGHEIKPYEGDVRNLAKLEGWVSGLDVVVHAAAIVPVTHVSEQPCEAVAVNVGGTANVALAASRAAGCRMVYISTSHVYRSQDRPISESDPVEPISLYGLSKWQGEEWVRRLSPDGLIIRVFSFFDDRQPPPYLMASLRQRLINASAGAELDLHGSNNVRDLADAQYLGDLCARLVLEGGGGVVNCGSGRSYSIGDIARTLAGAMGREDIVWREAPSESPNVLVANMEAARQRLGQIAPFDLRDALMQFAFRAA